jgi:hypothetical protein
MKVNECNRNKKMKYEQMKILLVNEDIIGIFYEALIKIKN